MSHRADRSNTPFSFTLALAGREVADLLCTVFEGGSNDWVQEVKPIGWTRPEGHKTPWYDDEEFVVSNGLAFEIHYDGGNDEEGSGASVKTITQADIKKGLAAMGTHAPHSLYEILNDNHDALSADAFFQCVVFGEVIYG